MTRLRKCIKYSLGVSTVKYDLIKYFWLLHMAR